MTDVLDQPDASRTRRRRRRWPWAVLAVLVAAVAFVLIWFQPQKLFIDERVVEPIPTVAAIPAGPAATPTTTATSDAAAPTTGSPSASTAPSAPAEPAELQRGEFVSLDHSTQGVVRVLELADGTRIVRLEGLATENGPDLFVYLTANPATGKEGAFDDDYVNLGSLKGNQGDQNYDLPAGTDLSRFASVVIWCDRFDSAFGAADLTAS